MKIAVKNIDSSSAGTIELNEAIFGLEPREDIIKRVVEWQLLKRMSGTHSTRTVSEISGTTKKPFKQKGTGNARQGSLRSAQMRGGGVAHGPRQRSHAIDLNKKIRKLALKHALSAKLKSGNLIIIKELALSEPKTKILAGNLGKLAVENACIITAELDNNFTLACRNIPRCKLIQSEGINVYDIMKYDHLVLAKSAVEAIEKRLVAC